jgi:DNA-binding GntR family transcriptional regulator
MPIKTRTESKDVPIRSDLRRIVLERIVRGELAPGVRIKESRLAEELGTSRTPLREALIKLEQEGFVRSELAHGFSVEPLSGREVRETYPLLWTLEGLALRSSGAALYPLLGELSRINTALANSREPEERLRLDTQWHETLLSTCPNRRLNGIIVGLRTAIRRYEHLFMSDAELVVESVHQHRQIIEALQVRDVERAERILTENWRVSMELLLVRLGEP